MLTIAAGRLAEVTGGEVIFGSDAVMANGLVIDSREVTPGTAFVAFVGEQADGHDYVAQALTSGARVVVVTRDDEAVMETVATSRRHDAAVVKVADALDAVQRLAIYHRERLGCAVVGITGSTGKTTTKDLVRAALGPRLTVVATEGNRNNELGVPLTVLAAGAETDVLVIEMAMRGAGQIARLCEIARPTCGLVTNVGVGHMELLGTQEAIARAKAELVEAVPPEGRVFLNGDDAWSQTLAGHTVAAVTYYGMGPDNDVRAEDVRVLEDGRVAFKLAAAEGCVEVTLPVPGRHNAYNAAAAAAVGLYLELGLEDVAEGLAAASVSDMRMQVFESAGGVTVINDAYNANPTSMRAAMQSLVDMRTERSRIAVLGDMAELGSLSELAHFELGEEVARSGIDVLLTVGTLGQRIADGALAEGMPGDRVRPCATPEEASEVLDDLLGPGDIVLVKASRVMGLERVVEGIIEPRV